MNVLHADTLTGVTPQPYTHLNLTRGFLNHQTDEFIFGYGMSFNATPPWYCIDYLYRPDYSYQFMSASQDGATVFAQERLNGRIMLATFKKTGYNWEAVERISLPEYYLILKIYNAADNQKVCVLGTSDTYWNTPNLFTCIDLAEWRAAL